LEASFVKSKVKIYCAALAALSGIAGAANLAKAGTFTWDGGGADDKVSTPANWVGDVAPKLNYANNVTADDLIFAGTTRLTPSIDVNATQLANTITFDATAGAFTLDGTAIAVGNTKTSNKGGDIINNSAFAQTFNMSVAARAGVMNANTADLIFNGGFNVGNGNPVNDRTNFFSGAANIYLNSVVTGVGRMTRQGTGTLFLTNNGNNYQGETRIENGVVRISAANALGVSGTNAANDTRIAGDVGNSGRLELVGGITFAPESLLLEARQGATANAPHLVNVSGNNTWTGAVGFATGGSEYIITSQADKLTMTGDITNNLVGTRNLRFGGAANGEVTGNILYNGSGVMNVMKEGAGTWTLSGSNSFLGNIAVNGGTLVINGYNASNAPLSVNAGTLKLTTTGYLGNLPSMTLATGGTFDVSDYDSSGGYYLPSYTSLSGGGNVKGQLNMSGGGSVAGGSVAAPQTLTFKGGLNFTGSAAINAYFTPTAHSTLAVTGGTLSATGSNDIKVSGFGITVGQYPLLTYTGTLGGDGFSAFNLAQVPPRAIASLVNNTAAHSIDLNITGIDFPKWTGAVNQDWDIDSTHNWQEVNSGSITTYLQPGTPGDAVLFDDTATNLTVNLTSQVAPANVTVNNATKNFLFTGGGSITGLTALTKNGAGTLVLGNGMNDYTGGTFINGGTLQVGDPISAFGGDLGSGPVVNNAALVFNRNDFVTVTSVLSGTGTTTLTGQGTVRLSGANAGYDGTITVTNGVLSAGSSTALGSSNGATIVLPGGTLDVNGNQLGKEAVIVGGAGFSGQGAIINLGGGQNNSLQNVTLTGDTTFGGSGRWDIRNLGNLTQLSTGGNAYNLTKIGGNQISFVDVNIDPALGDVNVNEGILSIEHTTNGLGDPTKTVTIASSGSFQLWALDAALDKKIVSNGGTIIGGSGTSNTLLSTIDMSATTLFRVNSGATLTVNNVISGAAAGLTKDTAGTLVLVNGANTYTGATTINGGVIAASVLPNGGMLSSIGQSSSDATNLILSGGGVLRYSGAVSTSTDRLMTVNGTGGGVDASGAAGPTLTYSNPGAVVMANTSTSTTSVNFTLTGSNAGDNIFNPTLADAVDAGGGKPVPTTLSKTGFGTWVLPNANTFTGNVSVTGGVLKVRNGGALGASSNTVSVIDATANVNPASVVFDNPAGATVANNFATSGGGGGGQNPDGPGILHAVTNTTLTGTLTNISGGGFSTYTADAGATLTITGTITNDQSRTLYMAGAGTGLISGVIQNGKGTMSLENRGPGTWNITGVQNTYTGGTTVTAGTLNVSGSIANSSGVTVNGGAYQAASAQIVKALTVNGGVAAVTSTPKIALTVGDGNASSNPITITGGSLDLQTNGVIVHYASGNDTPVLQSVRGQIVAAFNTGGAAWTGSGITSTNAAASSSNAVGYALASEVLPFTDGANDTFMGSPVDKNTVVARFTLAGDATLDGGVDFNDLVKLAQNYNTTVSTTTESWWNHGDFTYDGIVDFNDLVKLAQNYNTALPSQPIAGAPAVFEADLARAFASVPEPSGALLSLIAAGGLSMVRRRRRK
jgi:fibronectin-binding autotransporter adhesin